MKSPNKIILCVSIIIISMSSLCIKAFAAEEPYLQKYFKTAISLFEDKKYEQAIKVFEQIIEIEDERGEFHFTPFVEIYIDKAKARNVKLIPKKRRVAESKSKKVLISEHVEKQVEAKGEVGDQARVDRVYEEFTDYYDEKQKSPSIITTYSAEDEEDDIEAYLDEARYKYKGLKSKRKILTRKEKVYDESGWTRLGPKPAEGIKPKRKIITRKEEVYDESGWTRLGPKPLVRIERDSSREDGEFGDLLYEAIDSGVENLDDDMLMFFDDQRFKNIVGRIATYKLRKRTW